MDEKHCKTMSLHRNEERFKMDLKWIGISTEILGISVEVSQGFIPHP